MYNVDYSFELLPDPNNVDRAKDLKVWIPMPREWDSQKAVKIISVEPEPHAKYVDPEYGNPMLFWDFDKEPEKPSYEVNLKYRLESYEIHTEIDPNKVKAYNKSSEEYRLYTRSTHTVRITPQIREMAREAVGDETNPYLQAKRIFDFVRKKMRYKILDIERGRGIECLLEHPAKDEETGEEYYEGCCSQYSAFFCVLCRATGIPARAVFGFIGGRPWFDEQRSRPLYSFETESSPEGLVGVQHFGSMNPHMWAEFLLVGYGWVSADAQTGRFCHLDSGKVIMNKGRDVQIGPYGPREQSKGYGSQWVLLHDGRADFMFSAVWNIANMDSAKVKVLYHPDPFPAHALSLYNGIFHRGADNAEQLCVEYCTQALTEVEEAVRGNTEETLLADAYKKNPRLRYRLEPFICHMLRKVVGDDHFFNIYETYVDKRVHSGKPISTEHFKKLAEDIYGEPLGWFFNQWVNSTELPRLELEKVAVRKDTEGWQVHGRLLQSGDTTFRLPIELAIDTKNGREMQKLWIERKATDFDFSTQNEPQKLIVDPDYEVLKIQRMPPRLEWFWDVYPNLIVIYGTISEAEANKAAAERFNKEYLDLDDKIIKADTDVNDTDMKTRCLILFGRPETNKIAQQFEDNFPVKFDDNKFTYQGITYDKPTQGVAQIDENPKDAACQMVMYAGLSPEATLKFCDLYLYDADASVVIFEDDKESLRGDWEVDSELIWKFEENAADKKL